MLEYTYYCNIGVSKGDGFAVNMKIQNVQMLYSQEQPNNFELPIELKGTYRILSFLKYGKEKKTLLLQNELSGEKCILKIASGKARVPLISEEKILRKLRDGGISNIPKPIMTQENDSSTYFLREYIEGYTLRYVVEKSGGYAEQDLLELVIRLCDAVFALHEMDEPVIHRDIKPENIIVRPNGAVNLIDMETARIFSIDKENDTIYLGTFTTAAPEQYGYAQTDTRTDIYAIGMTMLYLATGGYDRNELSQTDYSAKTKKAILKCCSFDPAQRYQTVMELKKALVSCTANERKKHYIYGLSGVFACMFLLFCVFHFNTVQMKHEAEKNDKQTVVFKNGLLEKAVRLELGIDEDTSVTYNDLKNVHRIALIGYEKVDLNAEFAYRKGAYVNDIGMQENGKGSISDISLLANMPNLYELILCQQRISDIKPLQGLPISKLVLADNNIADLSPISELPKLEELYIGNNPAADLTPLGSCTRLRLLNLDNMNIKNLEFLNKLSLDSLSVCSLKLSDWDWGPIASQTMLRHYATSDLTSEQAVAVNQLTNLYEFASWWNSKLPDLTELDRLVNLRILIILDGFQSLKGIENMKQLNELFIGYNNILDISLIKELPELKVLGLDNSGVEDFSPLFECPSLIKVMQINDAQRKKILQMNPDPAFQIQL
jgi:hypothetical protein